MVEKVEFQVYYGQLLYVHTSMNRRAEYGEELEFSCI